MLPATKARTVVIAGNPNTGKSTLFNQLTGGRARVGNYPGITVTRHTGELRLPDLSVAELIDSPGTYSLAARSPEEFLALSAIAGLPPLEMPDLVVAVVDATQLTRNLYLVLQILELEQPVVVALNMVDELERSGQILDAPALERVLGVPVVALSARRGQGIDDLKRAIAKVLHDPARGRPGWRWVPQDPALLADIDAVAGSIPGEWKPGGDGRRRALALWALLSLDDEDELTDIPRGLRDAVAARRAAAEGASRHPDREAIEGRYGWIDAHSQQFLTDHRRLRALTDRVDRVLLHPVLGFGIFLTLMTLLFQALFTLADPLIGWIEDGFHWLGVMLASVLPDGLLADFVQNALVGGVGAFVVFLPQILILTLFLVLLEDTGYMARVAVLMDRVMRALGLHGRAFVPMLSGYACAIPAILATRTMERRRDRLLTMMVIPLMTCSARLPVYGLLIAAIVRPGEGSPLAQGMLLAGMYVFGTLAAMLVALVLGRTLLKGPKVPLLIEMPPYRLPHGPSVASRLVETAREFVTTAGGIILVCAIGMWLLLAFPRGPEPPAALVRERAALSAQLADPALGTDAADRAERRLAELHDEERAVQTRASFAGKFGRALEPVLEPLGFDWRAGIGIVGAFAAREVFVSTMGVVFGVGDEVDEQTPALRERLAAATWPDGRRLFTPLACLSLMVFFALACQCMSTLVVIARETRSWTWPAFTFAYMTVLAWCASFAVYQGGRLLGFS